MCNTQAVHRRHEAKRSSFRADVMQISPGENNGTHGSMNHVLRQPFYAPAPPPEQSGPLRCPLTGLDPMDPLGCSCPALVGFPMLTVKYKESFCKFLLRLSSSLRFWDINCGSW